MLLCFLSILVGFVSLNFNTLADEFRGISPYLAYQIVINNEEIGIVKSIDRYYALLNKLDAEFIWFTGDNTAFSNLKFIKVVSYGNTHPNKQLYNNTVRYLKAHRKAWGISVNNMVIATVNTKQDAELLEQKINSFFTPEGRSGDLIENLRIEPIEKIAIAPVLINNSQLFEPEDALKYLLKGTKEEKIYQVKRGDTIWGIANTFGISLQDLQKANPTKNLNRVYVGDTINLLVPKPFINVKTSYTHTFTERIQFQTIIKRDPDLYRTQSVVEQPGMYGSKKVVAAKILINNHLTETRVLRQEILSQPQIQIIRRGIKRLPDDILMCAHVLMGGNGIITSYFGPRWGKLHTGIDLAVPVGTPVYAFDQGTVRHAGYKGSYGLLVILEHPNGTLTYYGHLSAVNVQPGESVAQGQQIALSGNSGFSTGPHVHFEVRVDNKPVDPLLYIKTH